MTFDPAINVGNIFEVVAVIAFIGAAIWRLRAVEKKLDELKDVVSTLARQDQRLQYLEEAIRDLRHGRGFVLDTGFAGRFPTSGS